MHRTFSLLRRGTAGALAVLLALLAVPLSAPAHAQLAVYDNPNHVENIQQALRALYAIYQRIEQIRHLIAQVEWMADQLKGLKDPKSREVATLLYRLSVILRRGKALVYSLEDLAERYEELYPGFEALDDPPEELREQVEVILDTASAVLVSTREMGRTYVPAQRAIGRMKAQLDAAETNAELIQAAGLISAWTGEEVSKLLQQTAALTNLQAVYIAHQVNAQAQAEATFEDWVESGRGRARDYDGSAGPDLIPDGYPGKRP
jgi:P-type conjugative transfer protein TrbJ